MLEAKGEAQHIIAGIMGVEAIGSVGIHITEAYGSVFCAAVGQAGAYAPEKVIGAASGRMSLSCTSSKAL